ncbi:hypothetical protein NADFUDRAFT_82268 [Nadsonia fulvescens var. elongata DSM 6958]|uniref:Histone acetyltransferase GCN5 n=1 Tax=Nadsonia fulvescens var. elongata DSM 6958 TaxID=857566 RepID=A0A1E3PLZ4_9ASCO|nr:hypothetical protein NADFUDRAFT_82268 [Nadsonia fulvescens var. elongata DSM 6958]
MANQDDNMVTPESPIVKRVKLESSNKNIGKATKSDIKHGSSIENSDTKNDESETYKSDGVLPLRSMQDDDDTRLCPTGQEATDGNNNHNSKFKQESFDQDTIEDSEENSGNKKKMKVEDGQKITTTIPNDTASTLKYEAIAEPDLREKTEINNDQSAELGNDTENRAEKFEIEKEAEEDDSSITRFVFDGVNYKYKERPAVIEEKEGVIEFRVVNNDNSKEHMMILTGLKNIFQKQLPKMPREYIARLVYDRSHISIAIVKKPLTVVGGITYRPFDSREFAEIVFCAISSTEQVRGYGAHLMNHLKDYVKATSPINYFLTYADNYAIGYFKKQGFTKEITFEKQRWMGYIKDYEGGTLMQCSILPRIRYLDAAKILLLQKAVIMKQIRATSKSHVIRPGLDIFKDIYERREARKALLSKADENLNDEDYKGNDDYDDEFEPKLPIIDPMDIPGLKEAGWTPEMDELARRPKRGPHFAIMQHILSEMQNHPSAWPFAQPVNKDEVPDYYDIIKEPMDLSTMEQRLEADVYTSMEEFIYDARLVFNNCRSYNNETTTYYKNATKLEKFMNNKIVEIPEYSHLID